VTAPKKYWITDGDVYALVTGVDQRDHYLPLGWSETDEPVDGFVYVWREGIEKPGRAPVSLFHLNLEVNGWVAGPPEDGEHPLADQADAPIEPESAAPAGKPTTKAAGTGGNEKE
jgi:hypothetical protein